MSTPTSSKVPGSTFKGARLKVERANHHIAEFEGILGRYVSQNVKSLRPKHNGNRRKPKVFSGHLPPHTPTIVGDAIHNLRTALDHVYCDLVEANGGTVNRNTTFPFHKDRMCAEASINGHIKLGIAPSAEVIEIILDVVKPFENGGGELYGVHALDITDKHRILIGTDAYMDIERLDYMTKDGPTGGGMSNLTLVIPYGVPTGFIGLDGRTWGKLHDNPYKVFDIRFADGQPFERESIIGTLKRLSKITGDTVEALAKLGG